MGCSQICFKKDFKIKYGSKTFFKNMDQIIEDINLVNSISNCEYFEKRCGFLMEFRFLYREKKILFESINEQSEIEIIRIDINSFRIRFKKFYEFLEKINSCLPIFKKENHETTYANCEGKNIFYTTPDEENICCICFLRKNNIILECNHIFCEECITQWVVEKDKSCPMCRKEVDLIIDSKNNYNLSNRRWSIIDKNEINFTDYLKELDDTFVDSFIKLIS